MHTKHIDIHRNSMRYMVEDKYMDIKYIRIEEKPADIMTNNCSEAEYVKHMERITQGELWELAEARRDNDNNIGVMDVVIYCDSTGYSSHSFAEVVDEESSNDWILVTRSRIGK